jgi:hypothetical protein
VWLRSLWFLINVALVVPVLIILVSLIILSPVKFSKGPDADGYYSGASFDWWLAFQIVFRFLTLSPIAMGRSIKRALDA